MTGSEKQAYYDDRGVLPGLAALYLQRFAGARSILDVGCGTGDFGRHAPDGVAVHGVDSDAGAVALAGRYETAVQVDLETDDLPYEDGTFDAVLAKDVLEHLMRPERLVREIHRVLRPGGVVVASVVMARPKRVWADYTHVRGFTEGSARLMFADAGFAVHDSWPMGGIPLTHRLHLMRLVPLLLRVPPLQSLWGSSWELEARRTSP